MDSRANPLIQQKVIGVVLVGLVAGVTSPTTVVAVLAAVVVVVVVLRLPLKL